MTDIDTMEAGAEYDALVAVEVMEWKLMWVVDPLGEEFSNWVNARGVGEYRLEEWTPSTDIALDYEVLEVARKWPEERRLAFCKALWSIWSDRPGRPIYWVIQYQPGDYSRAALKAVRATKQRKEKP